MDVLQKLLQRLTQIDAANEFRAVEADVDKLIAETDDGLEADKQRLIDAQFGGSADDRRQIKEEIKVKQEFLQDLETISAGLPARIKAAEDREISADLERKHPEAKKLQQRELALHVDLYKLSSGLMATLEELSKTTPALSKLNAEFSSAGRRDLYVPVAEVVLRGKTGIVPNYRLDMIINSEAVRDITRSFGLDALAREFGK